ncbi:MAG: branched-chain amino acid ABC transporter permease [Ferrovibrio sp.]|uniref:branched-chain amino acid ABC transporter permease n=1 Tax=Ferrovibrio sp. TaxID=1917215 RepID=UPI0026325F28|nr:branched-chain amino acid ABC transporter permease [Ferrovibrio sp.]MCW0235057.1 branched-chain amino acid ABC transporter permease [Ferrovibrio sp.]
MRILIAILVFFLALLPLPLLIHSDFWITWLTLALFYAYLGQAWNLLGGYGGQFSFGHALFFGTGAYCTAVLQIQFGVNAWGGFVLAAVAAGIVGAGTGWLVFRYGLRGSYFALVTLAFAEVFRILANTFSFTGAGVGLLVPLQPGIAQMQFETKAGFFWLLLLLVVGCLLFTWWMQNARFGARLMAVRENEDAARALGVDPFSTKLLAITASGAIAGSAGAVYVQLFLYIDPNIAYGPAMSVEALLVPIIGGLGTIFGPVLGAFALHAIAEIGQLVFGEAPGLNLVLYGLLLVVMVLFLPNGLFGLGRVGFGSGALRRLFKRSAHA